MPQMIQHHSAAAFGCYPPVHSLTGNVQKRIMTAQSFMEHAVSLRLMGIVSFALIGSMKITMKHYGQ